MSLPYYAESGEYYDDVKQIVFSNAYRRLAHKSQIIVKPARDHFRSRLTHTEEVNQIAFELGRNLNLNQGLIRAMAKAHDLGHTPFGHAGERALQQLISGELAARFNVNRKDDLKEEKLNQKNSSHQPEPEKLNQKTLFHHSSNSARILIKEDEFQGIRTEIVNGVLTHSWKPWGDPSEQTIPTTYEGQVVAIADQLASINHDTEDIIGGAIYTEYDERKFFKKLKEEFKRQESEVYKELDERNTLSLLLNTEPPCHGRKVRTQAILDNIIENSIKMLQEFGGHLFDDTNKSNQIRQNPLSLSRDVSEFVKFYEFYIKVLVKERVTWFILRDNMAAALISTVFNHLWPPARKASAVHLMEPPYRGNGEYSKTGRDEIVKYIKHFKRFYKNHYFDHDVKPEEIETGEKFRNIYDIYLSKELEIILPIWDKTIWALSKEGKGDLTTEDAEKLTRLIAVVDFIAGMSDRFCLEIFDQVYKEFVVT